MFTYYNLDIIPIIFNRFKVKNIVISGMLDDLILGHISNYCKEFQGSYVTIDLQDNLNDDCGYNEFISLSNFKNYDAILLNDDPNWYTVYNELQTIKKTNDEFPLVLICHNLFPHKRRDSYINPDYIPDEFKNAFSRNLDYGEIQIFDDFFHAIEDKTPKNGVLTAIEDFLNQNKSIGMMDIKLFNGITILYYKNSISQIRLGMLNDEIKGHEFNPENILDIAIENQILKDNFKEFTIFDVNYTIDDFKDEITKKEKLIHDYEDKLAIHKNELNHKNSQIFSINSKLSLTEAQIENIESKLVNREVEIDNLKNLLKSSNDVVDSLKIELEETNNSLNAEKNKFDNQSKFFNSEINSLNSKLIQKEQIESELNNKLNIVNIELKNKDKMILIKDDEILTKQNELNDRVLSLNLIKRQYNNQLAKLDTKDYCISCYERELHNNKVEIQYLKKEGFIKKLLNPLSYVYLILKSHPRDLTLNLKLYKALKNSACFDIGFYLNNNKDLFQSKWCKYFSPELHYVCHGFDENRMFNKKFFDKTSKKNLLDYILNCK